jgi:hypothetical protein
MNVRPDPAPALQRWEWALAVCLACTDRGVAGRAYLGEGLKRGREGGRGGGMGGGQTDGDRREGQRRG